MAYVQIPKFGLAIDWETTGYSLPHYAAKHQGISFGAIVYESATFEPVETIYREIKFNPKYEWSDGAEKIHGLTRAYLEKNGVSQEEAAADLGNLIIKYFGTEDVQILAHRAQFDKSFNVQLFESIGITIPWHPTMIDSCVLGSALLEISKSDDLFDILGLPPRGEHNALEDIMYTLDAVKKMKAYFTAGVAASL